MHGVVKTSAGFDNTEYRQLDVPSYQPDEVLVRVAAAGICGTDMSLFAWRPNMATRAAAALPLTMGHEFSGTVIATGSSVSGLAKGDRVTGNPNHYCGICSACATGRTAICANRPTLGINRNGSFAEFVAVRGSNLYRLPQNLSLELGALSDTVAGAVHALERVPAGAGERIVIFGCGPLGLVLAMVLRAAGAGSILMFGRTGDEARLQIASSLGAITGLVDDGDSTQMVLDWTGGVGADVAFEMAGHPSAVAAAVQSVRPGGRVGLMGLPSEPTELSTSDLVRREVDVIPICAYYPSSWIRTVHLLEDDALPLERVVSHRLPLAEYRAGVELMASREAVKVLLLP